MARIVDFNINNTKTTPTNSNSCSVVINNVKQKETVPSYPQQVVYPSLDQGANPSQFQSVAPTYMTHNASLEAEQTLNLEELYKLLAITFSNILKDNNPKLIANIMDNSGKIIVDAANLIKIISLLCGVVETDIHIEYISKDKEVGCTGCSKINPIKQIENIKIGYVDFKLGFNDKYNMLTDTFNVSLKKCIIPIMYGY